MIFVFGFCRDKSASNQRYLGEYSWNFFHSHLTQFQILKKRRFAQSFWRAKFNNYKQPRKVQQHKPPNVLVSQKACLPFPSLFFEVWTLKNSRSCVNISTFSTDFCAKLLWKNEEPLANAHCLFKSSESRRRSRLKKQIRTWSPAGSPKLIEQWKKHAPWLLRIYRGLYFGYGPFPATVTTRIITCLVGNPYKPLFATVTGKGPHPNYTTQLCGDYSKPL